MTTTPSPSDDLRWGPYGILERLWVATWGAYTVITFLLWDRAEEPWRYQGFNLFMLAASIGVPLLTRGRGAGAENAGRIAVVLLSCFISYEWVAMILRALPHRSYELLMLQLDARIFGGNPSVWMERINHPVLTEYFQTIYVCYFPLLLLVGVALLLEGKAAALHRYILAFFAAVVFNHACYVLVPVQSPFLIADIEPYSAMVAYTTELHGLWYADSLREGLLKATTMRYDCFPSGHTMHSLIAVYFAWRARRSVAVFATVVGVSIVLSTLYLRYHYGVDLLAGALGAALWIHVSGRLLEPDRVQQISGRLGLGRLKSILSGE